MANNFADNNNMTALMRAIGNKIKNAGHTIYNSAGSALAKRSKLQFTGRLKTVDNSTDNITVVDDSPEHIEWDDWLVMSDQERANVKEAVIDNAPGVDGGLTANLMTKLWENSDPSVAFASQTITLNDEIPNYDFLLIVYRHVASRYNRAFSSFIPAAASASAMIVDLSGDTTTFGVRHVERGYTLMPNQSRSSISFNMAGVIVLGPNGAETFVDDNNWLIPEMVYGVKSSINLKFSAIASDISTAADHCIMSDGVTNVEDEIMAIKQPETIICGVITGTSGTYVTFTHEFPKSLPIVSARITQVFYIGLPPQPTVNIPIVLDTSLGTDMSIPYALISDATMMNNMRTYATSVEIEITYA